ncbi:GAF domain-containing sensor histidine kinase [Phormidesmis priestleyi]|uniref:GAF domain-containing sensor histidine kinase n=1 Tax=Phormidesmis priestleyi TaxID=268141 RepID=UPI001FD3B0D9|nr:ATP-binding protein [Phormidesmis priestleyi]
MTFSSLRSDNSHLNPEISTDLERVAELVMTQDAAGNVLSFYWQDAGHTRQPGQSAGNLEEFAPVAIAPYLERIKRVLDHQTPEQFRCLCHCRQETGLFELLISPILLPGGNASMVIVTGKRLAHNLDEPIPDDLISPIALPLRSDRYQKLLTQIAWNIRRTLDLSTIWQQTVDALGKALDVSRCVICPFEALSSEIEVVAEYRQESLESLLGMKFSLADDLSLREVLATLKPVSAVAPSVEGVETICATTNDLADRSPLPQARLMVATCYQEQPNGVIVLYQCDRTRSWTPAEIEFMQELADQVGTAIAHASLFAESQNLAIELQRVNSNLLQKHRELEEARHQAEEASRLKSEFLANTSHELRTPLNGMIGFLKLILDGMADDPEEQREFTEEAHNSALHLGAILEDVLDIAKIEAGKMQIESSRVSLDEILLDIEKFASTQLPQKNLSFEIQKPPTYDEIVLYANYQRLKQVMLNLVNNAIKFTHEGGITITVEVVKKRVVVQGKDLPGMVKVRVADTGIGVSLEKQDKLFQSFSQVDGSLTRQYGGTGLGLAISQKLVDAMGGDVRFYSMGEGLGSTVTFTVPLYQEPVMIS